MSKNKKSLEVKSTESQKLFDDAIVKVSPSGME